MLDLQTVLEYKQQITSNFRELQFAVSWWKRCYDEAKEQTDLAWKLYIDAIDEQQPREQINDLYIIASMFENNQREAWRFLDRAKAAYLAAMN